MFLVNFANAVHDPKDNFIFTAETLLYANGKYVFSAYVPVGYGVDYKVGCDNDGSIDLIKKEKYSNFELKQFLDCFFLMKVL